MFHQQSYPGLCLYTNIEQDPKCNDGAEFQLY